MKKSLLSFLIFTLVLQFALAQSAEHYSRVRIDLTQTELSEVGRLGLEIDHGDYAKGRHLINDFSDAEMQLLRQNNIPFEILIANVQDHYTDQNHHDHEHHHGHARPGDNCDDVGGNTYDYVTPENYVYGSMGGYLTYDELQVELEKMAAIYPDLITAQAPIGDIRTHEDRPIQWLRVSDNATVDEDEPEVLYTALHHAREPNSLSQMVFYLWYLLENYETNDEVKYLVDNTEMYFIPVVNPDGYVYNQLTNPEGGGLWRKNRLAINGEVFGVDLNRNYDYEWGFDDNGSSPNPSSNTYRGAEGFSEPETQAVRDFCNAHNFKLTLNYHTFGNLLIYPWGFSDSATPDHETFVAFGNVLSQENNYFAGTGSETVGYVVNGDSDDWMYGDSESKPPIFAMTPEVGDGAFGFWPPQSEIDRLNKSALLQNLVTAHLLLNYGEVREVNAQTQINTINGTLDLQLKKYGLEEGTLTVEVQAITDNVIIDNLTSFEADLMHLEEQIINVNYTLSEDIDQNDQFQFEVKLSNGKFTKIDTITREYKNVETVETFADAGDKIENWSVSGSWAETQEDFVSGPSSYTDSPDGDYISNSENIMDLDQEIDLEGVEAAFIRFQAKWDIEKAYDYAQVMISTDRVTYTPLCGRHSFIGNSDQDEGQPLYDGVQQDWVEEQIDISEYVGQTIFLRFRLVTDQFVVGDGFYFDDLQVLVSKLETSTEEINLLANTKVFPNPTKNYINTSFTLSEKVEQLEIRVTNSLGQIFASQTRYNASAGDYKVTFNDLVLGKGIYFTEFLMDGKLVGTEKVVKL